MSRYKNCIVTEVAGLASFWLQYKRIVLWLGSRRALGRAGVGAGALGWALGERQALGVRGRAVGRCSQLGARAQGAAGVRSWRARGRRSARQAGREAAGARTRNGRAGARGHGMDARGRAAGAGRGQVGVLCTLTQFLARFDSVLFLSH